jgi:hypothetical protein
MPSLARISHHLDLYRYWLAKRGSRSMPARSDINPADIPALLPYMMLVDKLDNQLRWRLVGTAAVREIGRDPTGSIVGAHISTAPETAAAVRATYERVFSTAHPIFSTGELEVKSGANHNISVLLLPLSDDGAGVNMAVSTLIACFNFGVTASTDWLKGAGVKVHDVIDVQDAAQLNERCLDWERYCDDQRRRTEGVAEREQ